MAQKMGKEETELKVVPEGLTLCINNCGVTGNPATNNMCQKCFNTTTASSSASAAAIGAKFSEKSRRSVSIRSPGRISDASEARLDLRTPDRAITVDVRDDTIVVPRREVNRCSCCRRKIGLTGIRCRCGEMFCSEHRYSDRHDCSYDYKAAGREAISRENPVTKAAKIVRF